MEFLTNNAKWIWADSVEKDTYYLFKDSFNFSGEKTVLFLSCETNAIAKVNGKRVLFGHFAGYPFEKYYEEIDITKYLVNGENSLEITVFYEGLNSSTHIDDGAGLIYSVVSGEREVAFSSKNTKYALSTEYISGTKRLLTIQIGYAQTMENALAPVDFKNAVETGRQVKLTLRPVDMLIEGPFQQAEKISEKVFDLGKESCGYFSVAFDCEEDCVVNLSYGEYLDNGKVNRILPGGYLNAGRDFSFEFICKKGYNEFEPYFTRMAGRYLQVETTGKMQIKKLGIIPTDQTVTEKPRFLSGIEEKIYDTCIRTLKLCMHEHYEDCPWREQSLYSLDSRNQMLCGYYAFNESKYQRENLVFISKGTRPDGLLELTYPSVGFPAIPFFSLAFVVAVWEYIEHTNDTTIIGEVFPVIERIMQIFTDRIDTHNLLVNFDAPYWNFYEWSKGSDNEHELIPGAKREQKHDLLLNTAYCFAFERYSKICACIGKKIADNTSKIKKAIEKTFYDKDKNLYFLSDEGDKIYSQLGNAFACLVGLGNTGIIEKIKIDESLVPATLSMKGFVYDAILDGDKQNEEFVLSEIKETYSYMLSEGVTSFWEVIDGVESSKSMSLCHGWSAIPVYYYNKLLKKN